MRKFILIIHCCCGLFSIDIYLSLEFLIANNCVDYRCHRTKNKQNVDQINNQFSRWSLWNVSLGLWINFYKLALPNSATRSAYLWPLLCLGTCEIYKMQCGGMTDFGLAAWYVAVVCLSDQQELPFTASVTKVSNEIWVYSGCRLVVLG